MGINTVYRTVPSLQPPLLNTMIFLTGRHHGQDVVLATPSATLRPTQGQSLHQHVMGDTALACFGRISWIDRQGVQRARRRQSNDVDDDGDGGDDGNEGDRDVSDADDKDGSNDGNNNEGDVDGDRGWRRQLQQ
jgi:hypothetical protein